MKKIITTILLVTAMCGNSAWADEPTIQDAHDFIGNLVSKKTTFVRYLGNGKDELYQLNSYKGENCSSDFFYVNGAILEIKWGDINKIDIQTQEIVFRGNLKLIRDNGEVFMADFRYLHFSDEVITKKVGKAFMLLKNSCAKKSKFD